MQYSIATAISTILVASSLTSAVAIPKSQSTSSMILPPSGTDSNQGSGATPTIQPPSGTDSNRGPDASPTIQPPSGTDLNQGPGIRPPMSTGVTGGAATTPNGPVGPNQVTAIITLRGNSELARSVQILANGATQDVQGGVGITDAIVSDLSRPTKITCLAFDEDGNKLGKGMDGVFNQWKKAEFGDQGVTVAKLACDTHFRILGSGNNTAPTNTAAMPQGTAAPNGGLKPTSINSGPGPEITSSSLSMASMPSSAMPGLSDSDNDQQGNTNNKRQNKQNGSAQIQIALSNSELQRQQAVMANDKPQKVAGAIDVTDGQIIEGPQGISCDAYDKDGKFVGNFGKKETPLGENSSQGVTVDTVACA